jgi:hypothetical protein
MLEDGSGSGSVLTPVDGAIASNKHSSPISQMIQM